MVEIIVSFVSGVVVPLIPIIVKSLRGKNALESQDTVISHLDIQAHNQDILDEIRNEMNADRVTLIKFSNGTDFLDNTHILKLTMIAESNANHHDNIKQDFQGTPAYLFDRILNLLKTENYYVERNSEINQDTVVSIRKNYEINTAIGMKLYSAKGKWIGILGVCYSKDTLVAQDQIAWLSIKSSQIR